MAAPGKIKKLATQYDQPLEDVVLQMLNEHGTLTNVARELNISESNLFRFIDKQKIKKISHWVKAT